MWASIVAFFRIIPGIVALITYFKDAYEKYKQDKIIREAEKKKREIEKLTRELENAKTDQQRADILRRLSGVNKS